MFGVPGRELILALALGAVFGILGYFLTRRLTLGEVGVGAVV